MTTKTENKTHWKKHFNPNYLGSYSLEPGEERVLTIAKLKDEPVMSPDGKEEVLPVLYFTEGKPMIINKTNAKTVAKVAGSDYVEDWVGVKITIYIANVKAFGELTPALRIRPVAPKKDKLNADRYGKMIEAIKTGKFDKNTALDRFDLTPEQRKAITAL